MGDESKRRVKEKLENMALNILEPTGGYLDLSGLELTPTEEGGTLLGNYLKLKQYHLEQQSKMVGQPAVPASAWLMLSPNIMNCFYDPQSNSINIFPGFVTDLIYTDDMSDQELLSKIGFVVGHEISHGFDFAGAQLDAYGTPSPIFSDADVDSFVERSRELADYYKGLEIEPGTMVDGDGVVTEAAADLCGMHAILELAKGAEGVDYDRLFADHADMWAQVGSNYAMANFINDTHPLVNLRVNVCAQMFDPIYDALGVSEGDAMYLAPGERINIFGPNS